MHRLYLSCSVDLNCEIVQMFRKCTCTPDKRILGLSYQNPKSMVYGELGRYHLSVLASTRCVRYWLRLKKVPSSRYVKMAYNMLKSMAEEGHELWASRVKNFQCKNICLMEWINGRRNTLLD